MLHLFYGNDTTAVREAAHKKVDTFTADGHEINLIDTDNFAPGILTEQATAESLFGNKVVTVLDTPSAKAEYSTAVHESVEMLATSEHPFVVIETTLLAAALKPYKKYATSLEEYKTGPVGRFDFFALTDALARKDKKQLWVLLQNSRLEGIPIEEVVGMLWWQLKTLRLAQQTNSASEAGMKEFPYQKAKRALTNFTDGELTQLSHSLLTVQHESRLGNTDLDQALEHWVLTV